MNPSVTRPDPGRVGIALLILSEASFFSVFLVAYLFYIGKSQSGPFPGDVLSFPVLGTICLLTSSGTIVVAVRALEASQMLRFRLALFATLVLGTLFLVDTALEWRRLIEVEGLTIGTNLFGTSFYSLVGFHAAHVTFGVSMMCLLMALAGRGHLGSEHAHHVDLFSWYWHFVDVVWIAVVSVVYVVGV
jgi:cytochrome c oxidase subunit 3/cytochrome o ubiquinol oxidase subunit 3